MGHSLSVSDVFVHLQHDLFLGEVGVGYLCAFFFSLSLFLNTSAAGSQNGSFDGLGFFFFIIQIASNRERERERERERDWWKD